MQKKVGFGIIGIGNMGTSHVKSISSMPEAELVAVCDINPAAFDRIDSGTREKILCTTDYEEFFSAAGLECVIVAVPHYDHPDLAIAAMEHGKHVIVEKPIAVHKAEAERLLAAAAKHPELVKSAMFNQRMIPVHQKLKQLLSSGELGRITRINWIITDWYRSQIYYDSGDWRATWAGEGGGVLLNQCPHQLDMMQWFFGMPSLVSSRVKIAKYHDIEVEDEVNTYLEYPNGAVGNFITTTGEAPGTNRLEVACDMGKVILENDELIFVRNEMGTEEWTKTTKRTFGKPGTWDCKINVPAASKGGHYLIIENVAKAIRGGTELAAPLEEGINGLELGNSMFYSGMTGKDVNLPLDSAAYAELLGGLIKNSKYVKKNAKDMDNSAFSSSH